MITGDHADSGGDRQATGHHAREAARSINGKRLAAMSDEELDEKVEQIYVYARVSPEHKLRIVKPCSATAMSWP